MRSTKLQYKDKNPLTANNLHANFPDVKIYINNQLTKENKRLFWLAKEFSKTYGYNFVWSNSGSVYLKKNKVSKFIKFSLYKFFKISKQKKKLVHFGNSIFMLFVISFLFIHFYFVISLYL